MEILFRAFKDNFFGKGYVFFSEAQQEADEIGGKVQAYLLPSN